MLFFAFCLYVCRVCDDIVRFGSVDRGIVPSIVLSLNPSIQFLFFDQIKYFILSQRARAHSSSSAATAHTLSSIENFILGGLYVMQLC